MSKEKKCLHCQLPAKKNSDFCCPGCKFAYNTINKLGFSSYYENRIFSDKEINLKPEENPDLLNSDIVDFLHVNEEGNFEAYLLVKGLHCGACIWLIESILKKQDGVLQARINMTNKRLKLVFSGAKEYGNKLVQLINSLGYKLVPYDFTELQDEEKKYNSQLLKSLAVAGFGAGNVMLISVGLWSSDQEKMGLATHNFLYWLSAIIALPIILYCGRIFFSSALKSLRSKTSNMDIAISVAIIITTLVSLFEVMNKADHAYFDSAVMLIFFLTLGRYLDFATRSKALSKAHDFSVLGAISANIIDNDGNSRVILAKKIKKGMLLNVAVGDKIAADGIVISGDTEVDTSIITGETAPQKIKKDDEVFAGTINLSSPIKVLVNKNQSQSLLSKINNLVADLQKNKGKFERIADKVSRYYTPIVHILAFLTLIIWYQFFDLDFKNSLLNAVAVLIITCPCALALAVPISIVVANFRLLTNGIIIKSGAALEKLKNVQTIIFDKTGTLTIGQPILKSAIIIDKHGKESKLQKDDLIFRLSASLASYSNHPLSKSLSKYHIFDIINLKVSETVGAGLKAKYKNKEIKIGKYDFVLNNSEKSLIKPSNFLQIIAKYDQKIAIFNFSDSLKLDAKEVISSLRLEGRNVILLSGDKSEVVKKVAKEVGIETYFSNKNPLEKTNIVKEICQNSKTLYVGDGINDAPSLMASDVSLSFCRASDITKNTADIIIQGQNLKPVLEVLQVGVKTNKVIKENFILSFIYNIIAVPFAVMGYVTPFIAALSMSVSSIIVTLNSLKVKR